MLNNIIIFYLLSFLMISCEERVPDLKMVSEFEIDVKEPSGLCFGPGDNSLLTVSDNNGNIYELDFDGNVINKIKKKKIPIIFGYDSTWVDNKKI